ncbi:MAG: DUF642 domain-containing protein [Verrucomicrobiota bacterium]
MKPDVTAIRMFVFVGAVLTFGLGEILAQNLLINGSFETPSHSANSIISFQVGSTNVPGWNIEGTGSVYIVTTPLSGWSFAALDGQQFLDFNQATVSQTFSTMVGESYEVEFTAGHFQGRTNQQIFGEIVSSNIVLGSLTAFAPTNAGWSAPSRFRFAATGSTATLQFRGTNGTVNVDLAMDAVSVQRVAVPLSIGLIGISQVRLCWEPQTNRVYQLQSRSDLNANTWTVLGAAISGAVTNSIEQPVTEPSRFYRVVLLP